MALSPLAAVDRVCGGALQAARMDRGFALRILRRGTIHESLPLARFANGCFARGEDLVIDLSECRLADSTFVGSLIVMHKRARAAAGANFRVYAPDGYCAKLLESMQLHRFLALESERPKTRGEWIELPEADDGPIDSKRHALDSHRELASLDGPDRDLFADIVERLTRDLKGD